MPPKKKGNKKADQDDWEADLGETIAPANGQVGDGPNGAENEDDEEGGGGLMAMLRKRKEKRKQKGLPEEEQAETEPTDGPISAPQTAQDATMEDEFALPDKKGKGGKGKQQAGAKNAAAVDDADESGRVLTKAEKEKLKKEREKQRKKEQVKTI